MLIQLQLLPFIQHTFFLPCSAAAILQTAKVRESYVKSLPCFQCCSQEISHWPFCIHTCVVAVIGSLKLCSKIILISHTNGTHFPVFFYPISPSLFWNFSKKTVIQELRTRKNGLIKRFSRVCPIITHSRESSNSQRDPQDYAHS